MIVNYLSSWGGGELSAMQVSGLGYEGGKDEDEEKKQSLKKEKDKVKKINYLMYLLSWMI